MVGWGVVQRDIENRADVMGLRPGKKEWVGDD